jgi:hypothetical protein
LREPIDTAIPRPAIGAPVELLNSYTQFFVRFAGSAALYW